MGGVYRFWIHGVNIIPEWTKEYTGDDNGLYLQRTSKGAVIKQRKGTLNWFHFAIPTPTTISNTNPIFQDAYLRFKINTGAVIKHIVVSSNHKESGKIYYSSLFDSGEITITGQDIEYYMNIRDALIGGPMVISVQVYFEADNGEIILLGAGGRFKD